MSFVTDTMVEREFRNYYNPVRGLVHERLARILDMFSAGYLSEGARLFHDIVERDGILGSVVSKRKGSIAGLDWEIVAKGDDEELSKRQIEVLANIFENIEVSHATNGDLRGCLSLLIKQMLTALEQGHSVHEIIKTPSKNGLKIELRFVPLWFFERTTGKLCFKEDTSSIQGVPLKPGNWLVCANDKALMKAASIAYVEKRMATIDKNVYSARFAMPIPVGKTNANPNSDQWTNMENAIGNIKNGNGILLDSQSELELHEASGDTSIFQKTIDAADRVFAIIFRGSDLGTISNKDAAGASLQGSETNIFEDEDARLVEETLEHNLSRMVLDYYFGIDTPTAAKLVLRRSTDDTQRELVKIERAAKLGCPVAKPVVYDLLGLTTPMPEDELITVSQEPSSVFPAMANEMSYDTRDGLIKLVKAKGEDATPLIKALDEIEQIKDWDEYINRVVALRDGIGRYFNGNKESLTWIEILDKAMKGQLK